MVYRVTTGTKLMDTEPFAPRGNEGLGSRESGYSVNQSIHNPALRVKCVKETFIVLLIH